MRFAGELFNLEARENERHREEEVRRKLQSTRVVGVGFGERDTYGPDNSWDTKDAITYTPVPGYYKGHKNYVPPVNDFGGAASSR